MYRAAWTTRGEDTSEDVTDTGKGLEDGLNEIARDEVKLFHENRKQENAERTYDKKVLDSSSMSTRTVNSFGESIYASTIMGVDSERRRKRTRRLNDQQWVMQRKKIGLPRQSQKTRLAKLDYEKDRMSTIVFIQTHFNRKECTKYEKRTDGKLTNYKDPCWCGGILVDHHTPIHVETVPKPNLSHSVIEELDEESSEDNTSHTSRSTIFSIDTDSDSDISSFGEMMRGKPTRKRRVQSIRSTNSNENPNQNRPNGDDSVVIVNVGAKKDAQEKANDLGTKRQGSHYSYNAAKSPRRTWNPKFAIKEFPTNAYGIIEFEGYSNASAKYVRLADNSTMSSVMELLKNHWDLLKPKPHLALSIIGGAKNFKMDGRKKEVFKRGLISAAKATHALILTSGTNAGVMKLVGDAVYENQYLEPDGGYGVKFGLKAIGLAPFGYIHNNYRFINEDVSKMHEVKYNANIEIVKGKKPSLNPGHTHFLLIDDGHRNSYIGGKGVGEFISRFELLMMEPEPKGLGVPVVSMLLEGGSDAIFEVLDNLKHGQPLVIVDGSGRAADILAFAYKHARRNQKTGEYSIDMHRLDILEEMLEENYADRLMPEDKERKLAMYVEWIVEIIKLADLITIYDIQHETNLDTKILKALLKGNDLNVTQQLYLSMVWDRVDIAEEKVFANRNFSADDDGLAEVMATSLILERTQFVEVMILNGFSFHKYLTVERLRRLYNDGAIDHKDLFMQIETLVGACDYIFLRTIHKYFVSIFKSHYHPLYQLDRPTLDKHVGDFGANSAKTFEDPYMELFLWALLTKRTKLTEFFWAQCGSPLLCALLGATIYGSLANLYSSRHMQKEFNDLQMLKRHYVSKANFIMTVAYSSDKEKALSLIDVRFKRFGTKNLIQLAFIGNLRTFVAGEVCQEYVKQTWTRGMTKINYYIAVLAIFCPLLVLTPAFNFLPLGDDGGQLSMWQKLFVFYRAPFIKYVGHCISYGCFLFLYTYIALFNYSREFQSAEICLYVWFLILIIGSFRQVLIQPSRNLGRKFRDFLRLIWNKVDLFIYTLAIISFVMKNIPSTFNLSRVVFAANAAVLYTRLFRFFHASYSLGPKIVIFYRMISEIISFMLILAIFILGYGTASQALIRPMENGITNELTPFFKGVLLLPYWQMYGELNLEEIEVDPNVHCVATESTDEDGMCPDQSFFNSVTPVFLALYLIIANVMLLNLLIAIFTSVFEEVQTHSKEVWKWEMYRLCEQYDYKPGLAPPLVIIEDFFLLLKAIWKLTCRRHKEDLELMMVRTLETLELFEKDCFHIYLKKKQASESATVEKRVETLDEKIERLLELVQKPTSYQLYTAGHFHHDGHAIGPPMSEPPANAYNQPQAAAGGSHLPHINFQQAGQEATAVQAGTRISPKHVQFHGIDLEESQIFMLPKRRNDEDEDSDEADGDELWRDKNKSKRGRKDIQEIKLVKERLSAIEDHISALDRRTNKTLDILQDIQRNLTNSKRK